MRGRKVNIAMSTALRPASRMAVIRIVMETDGSMAV
jgi:hypothetical protein